MEDNQIRREINSIDIPNELNQRIMDGFMQAEKEINNHLLKKKRNIKKNFFLWSLAAVIFIGLFIGSTFVSPTMATIASKIPLFHKVFNRGPMADALYEHLIEQGFAIKNLSGSNNKISLSIDSKQYSSQKKKVKQAAKQFLQQQGYSNIEIKVNKYSGDKILDIKEQHPIQNKDFQEGIFGELKEAGFNTNNYSYRITLDPPEFTFVIPENDYEKGKNEIISIVKKAGDTYNVGYFKISFETYTLEESDRSARWGDIISTLNEVLLNQEEYSIKSFGSSVKENVKLYIQLDIQPNDSRAEDKVRAIEKEIHEFLSSQEIKKIIKDDRYQMIITSKDNQKLN